MYVHKHDIIITATNREIAYVIKSSITFKGARAH